MRTRLDPDAPLSPTRRRGWAVLTALALALVLVGLATALLRGSAPARGGAAAVRAALTGTAVTAGAEQGRVGEDPVSVEDVDHPTVAGLHPALREAVRRAATVALDEDGVQVRISSGWRSREYQQQLLDDAVRTYGSRREALRWVATPDASRHVHGDAVDVGRRTRRTGWPRTGPGSACARCSGTRSGTTSSSPSRAARARHCGPTGRGERGAGAERGSDVQLRDGAPAVRKGARRGRSEIL